MPIALAPPFRAAAPGDAELLARGVNYAGEGLPLYLWGKLAGAGESAWDVGIARAQREDGAFSYRNAVIIEHEGAAAGCLIGYSIGPTPEPIPDDMPPVFRPMQELENEALDTWYINVLAVTPERRGLSLGSKLLALAEDIAGAQNKRGTSLIVSSGNPGAARLYERSGYSERARRQIVKEDWEHQGDAWRLLTKPL